MLPETLLMHLSLLEKVELCGIAGGIKHVMRVCRNVDHRTDLHVQLAQVGLSLIDPDITFVSDFRTDGDQSFGHCVRSATKADGVGVYYITQTGREQASDALVELELRGDSDDSIGALLGIPRCCREFYASVGDDLDWLSPMLENTDLSRKCFKSCNQVAREYLGATLRPDFFPCSFQCEETRAISFQYRPYLRKYLGTDFLEDLELLCGLPVNIEENHLSIPAVSEKRYPIGSGKYMGHSLVFV